LPQFPARRSYKLKQDRNSLLSLQVGFRSTDGAGYCQLSDNEKRDNRRCCKRAWGKKVTEKYLEMFEDTIRKQAELMGHETALRQAKRAGLGVSDKGRIVSCSGHPAIVLLRLIRMFAEDGNLAALQQCSGLIKEIEKLSDNLETADMSADN
jgi:hypothetical protein